MKTKLFFHNVYFWLKEPVNQIACKEFEIALQKFLNTTIHTRTSSITKPAYTDREVVDNSYTYALLVSFDTKEKHDVYQQESAHQLFLEEASHLWNKVQVFDSVEL